MAAKIPKLILMMLSLMMVCVEDVDVGVGDDDGIMIILTRTTML